MSETDTSVQRLRHAVRLANVLAVVSSKRHAVTTTEVLSDMKFKYDDNVHQRTIFRCLECWEMCGFIRRKEPVAVCDPIRWIAMTRLVRVSEMGE